MTQPNQNTDQVPLENTQNFDPRGGVSPIGTTSPNSGSTGATNSTYAPGAYTSGITPNAVTPYTIQDTDYQGVVLFSSPGPVVAVLNSSVRTNFTCDVFNLDSGPITLLPTLGYTVNGTPSLTMAGQQGATVYFANRSWIAYVGSSLIPVVPATFALITHEWLNSYNATTGLFTASRPDYSDLTGTPTLPQTIAPVAGEYLTGYNAGTGLFSQSTPAGLSVTITTAKLTTGGTQGSQTFTNGILTAQVQAT